MTSLIVIDQPTLKECVESNIYQSLQFEAGESLARAFAEPSITSISQRVVPVRKKGVLYLLQSRTETGYLVIDPIIFDEVGPNGGSVVTLEDRLLRFQRVCRYALKTWLGLRFAFSEMVSLKTGLGVVFPYPKSKQNGFRVTLKAGVPDRRTAARHGTKQLYAFAAGYDEAAEPTQEQERALKRALEELSAIRISLDLQFKSVEIQPTDFGFKPLVLTDASHQQIRYQEYDTWIKRLTKDQKDFVTSSVKGPQRVEGPAGTGKTLCLILRAYYLCKAAEERREDYHALFVAHGDETRKSTAIALDSLGQPFFHQRTRSHTQQSIQLCTLQEWCANILGQQEIATSQFLDQDALQAKELRRFFIKDIVSHRLNVEKKSLDYLSQKFRDFFTQENIDYIAELLQHEIGVVIKGRASEKLEAYLALPILEYCIPAKTANDRRFIYSIYKDYQTQLNQSGVFDTDDIILSTLGRLDTPIWRRRRLTEGFDTIFVDETHLFNFNELSVFHHILKESDQPRIIFSIDRSQAPGERGITTKLVREILTQSSEETGTKTKMVFRCSPSIVKLAEAVTSAGATLFTTFENPLVEATSVITASDEVLATHPVYWRCLNDQTMCAFAVQRAIGMCNEIKCPANQIVLIVIDASLLQMVKSAIAHVGRRSTEMLHRGDIEAIRRGERDNAFIVSHPDYVGGLEFKGVLIVGADEGRLPPSEGSVREESRHFVEFKAYNRLYVSISRARLAVELFYSAERGHSPLLKHALREEALEEKNCPTD